MVWDVGLNLTDDATKISGPLATVTVVCTEGLPNLQGWPSREEAWHLWIFPSGNEDVKGKYNCGRDTS